MKIKVLKERTQNRVVENDLRGLGHFAEPVPYFELSLITAKAVQEDLDKIVRHWGMKLVVEEGSFRLSLKDSRPPHLAAAHMFFCAKNIFDIDGSAIVRIDRKQGLGSQLRDETPGKRAVEEPGLLVHPSLLYAIHRAGFWQADFETTDLERMMRDRSLLHFSLENVAILFENMTIEAQAMQEGKLSHAN